MVLNRLRKEEKGHALIIVLILLLLGGLIIAPMLAHVGTGLQTGKAVYEERMHELYAADAGFEQAFWELTLNGLEVTEGGSADLTEFTLNNCSVSVTVENMGASVYKITSVATHDSGSGTTVESYLSPRSLFDNAITSLGDVTIQPGSTVDGNVQYGGTLDNKGTISGNLTNEEYEKWPTSGQLSSHYWKDVDLLSPYPDSSIDIKDNPTIGPLYRDGDLEIKNTGGVATSVLEGTVYVTGDLEFKQPGVPSAYTIDLNGQTIFVEGSITFPAQRVSISGSGCIIAVGDVTFLPGIDSDPGDFVFVMSVEGEVYFSPLGDFTGSIAGDVDVDLQPGTSLSWKGSSGLGLNFPMDAVQTMVIRTWEISLQ